MVCRILREGSIRAQVTFSPDMRLNVYTINIKSMHKNFGRFFALASIAALTIFAGKTFAESRQQPLFAEKPVVKQEASVVAMNVPSYDVSVEDDASMLSAETPVATPVEETVHAPQVSIADTNINTNSAIDTAVASNTTPHFSIKKGVGDDDNEGRDDDDD